MKIKLPAKERADRIVSVRFTQSEYDALKAALGTDRNIGPVIRAIIAHAVKQGLEFQINT